jgi:type IV pilus assembly protein PilA
VQLEFGSNSAEKCLGNSFFGLMNGLWNALSKVGNKALVETIKIVSFAETQMRRKQTGFSLIELLIVVAIILIVAAIAIPNFLASRMAANESSAVQEARAITTAEVVYNTQYQIGYSALLTDLGDNGPITATSAGLIDSILASGNKSGYSFTYVSLNVDAAGHFQSYTLNANPMNPGYSGRKYFYTDQTAVIHVNLLGPATAADLPL